MALAPSDALAYAKRFIGSLPMDDTVLLARLLDDAHKKFWMADNWPWTVGTIEAVTLVNNTQDYSLASTPSDLAFLTHSRLVTSDTDQTSNDLKIASVLHSTSIQKGPVRRVAYIAGSPGKLRVFPVPTSYPSLPTLLTYYKKTPTAVTAGNYTSDYLSTFGVPLHWFQVYQEIVLLKAYNFARDPRGGSVTFVEGKSQFTGQYGVVESAIAEVRMTEKKLLDNLGTEVHSNG